MAVHGHLRAQVVQFSQLQFCVTDELHVRQARLAQVCLTFMLNSHMLTDMCVGRLYV